MYKIDSKGPKKKKCISSPGGSKDDLKNYKTTSKTQIAERSWDYYSISRCANPTGMLR